MKKNTASSPIGIFDSGVGGLTALRKLAELLPNENLLYLGDTARVPYGNRSTETIIAYTKECVAFLLKHNVKQILVACNTASAVALEAIQAFSPVPVTGVIKPAVDKVLHEKYQRVGIIGTRTTIQSNSYEKAIHAAKNKKAIKVYSQACPLFVPIIEEGWQEHAIAYQIAGEYLAPLKEAQIEALILGCTHYPFLTKVISEVLPGVDLIDSGAEAAKAVAESHVESSLDKRAVCANASRDNIASSDKTQIQCYVTDLTPTFTHLAQQFLGLPLEVLHQADLYF